MRIVESCNNCRRNNANPNPGNQGINLYVRDGQDQNNYVQQVHIEHLASNNAINQQNGGNQNAAQEMPIGRYNPGILSKVGRLGTMKVMQGILHDWKRTYSLKPENKNEFCCVCLVEFNKGDEVVELHCGKGHLFHPECIEDWAKRNKTCPLCRKDFVEVARKEQMDQLQEESKEEEKVSNNAIRSYSIYYSYFICLQIIHFL